MDTEITPSAKKSRIIPLGRKSVVGRLSPSESQSSPVAERPSPLDMESFLPWACMQFQSEYDVAVKSVVRQSLERLNARKGRTQKDTKMQVVAPPPQDAISMQSVTRQSTTVPVSAHPVDDPAKIVIQAIYNNENFDKLVGIKMVKNLQVPRAILQILQLIIKFHPNIETLTIDRGIDKYTIYETAKLLSLSKITELCFDNTALQGANYNILLDNPSHLKHLSLSRCDIEDSEAVKIAERLEQCQPVAKVLSVLNLSMNKITNVGAKALGKALRTNRQLSYLNLAGNMIDDYGADAILDSLLEFPIKDDEKTKARAQYVEDLNLRNKIIHEMVATGSVKMAEKADPKKKKPGTKSLTALTDQDFYEKAKEIAKNLYGPVAYPFLEDVHFRDGILFSNGNNTLAYINLAFNYLSVCTLKKFIKVLSYQSSMLRKPRGLINLNVEGNPFHSLQAARPLKILEKLTEIALLSLDRRSLTMLRPKAKGSAK